MDMTTLAIINSITNICENVSLDPRPASEIVLPSPHFVVDLNITPAVDWVWDGTTWVSVEGVGNGGIGDVWDGARLVQPQPTSPP
jgi:hypothetical protein